MLPSPDVLSTLDLAAEQARDLAADRQAEPVPPYLRLVVPSACWNASKISLSLSGGIPIPVSVTANAITVRALARTSPRTRARAAPARLGA